MLKHLLEQKYETAAPLLVAMLHTFDFFSLSILQVQLYLHLSVPTETHSFAPQVFPLTCPLGFSTNKP